LAASYASFRCVAVFDLRRVVNSSYWVAFSRLRVAVCEKIDVVMKMRKMGMQSEIRFIERDNTKTINTERKVVAPVGALNYLISEISDLKQLTATSQATAFQFFLETLCVNFSGLCVLLGG
jgi:hypothetical protein